MGRVAKHSWRKSLATLRGHHISTERDEEILRQLNRLLKHDDEGSLIAEPMRFTGNLETRGIALIEGSGSGKTTAVDRVLSTHPALKPTSAGDPPKFLRIQVPSPATLKSLGREVLKATGLVDVSPRASAWEIWGVVRHRLALLGIVVLWFDEAHDMFLSGSAREIDDMLKMLKSLMQNESAVIPILSGTQRLAEITRFDEQVNRRLTKVVPKPLCQGVDDGPLYSMIEEYCAEVGLKPELDDTLALRLIRASRHRFGRAIETIINAIESALEEGAQVLTWEHFATAWGMQEGCDWEQNVFAATDWAAIELDTDAENFEAERTKRQTRQVGRR